MGFSCSLNLSSLQSEVDKKVNSSTTMKNSLIKSYLAGGFDGVLNNKNGSKTPTMKQMKWLAEEYGNLIRAYAMSYGVPSDVLMHLENLTIEEEISYGASSVSVTLKVNINDDISRPSLYPAKYPDGLDNVVKLYDLGYENGSLSHAVWGYRGGKKIYGRMSWDGLGFIEDATDRFNSMYGKEWGAQAVVTW